MQLKYLYSIESKHATTSVYERVDGEKVIWVKVGQALLEVPMEIWDNFSDLIQVTNQELYFGDEGIYPPGSEMDEDEYLAAVETDTKDVHRHAGLL